MSEADLNRVRADLATMQQAAGLEPTFGRDDVACGLWLAASGALLAVWAALSPWELGWLALLPLAVAVLAGGRLALKVYRQRARRPAAWREQRVNMVAALIVLPLVVLYLRWERSIGMPREQVGAAAVFFVGLGMLLVALLTRGRLHYLGGAVALLGWGLALPYCSRLQVLMVGGLCVAVAGLWSAGVQAWQLQRAGEHHGAD